MLSPLLRFSNCVRKYGDQGTEQWRNVVFRKIIPATRSVAASWPFLKQLLRKSIVSLTFPNIFFLPESSLFRSRKRDSGESKNLAGKKLSPSYQRAASLRCPGDWSCIMHRKNAALLLSQFGSAARGGAGAPVCAVMMMNVPVGLPPSRLLGPSRCPQTPSDALAHKFQPM